MDLKKIFVLGTAGFAIVCFGLFYVLTNSISLGTGTKNQIDYTQVESKLRVLEAAVLSHRDSMKEIEDLAFRQENDDSDNLVQVHHKNPKDSNLANDQDVAVVKSPAGDSNQKMSMCSSAVGLGEQATSKINMLNVYEVLKFNNPNGGVWKQGWDIQIDHKRFSDTNKLKIFVIPHSHNDPGWIKTFEKYFEDQTKHILDNMLERLSSNNSTVKFIWAEMSYFNLWWDDLSDQNRLQVKKIVERKQLEFVTGGWVMPDEANSHYYSILTQLIEGHQWLLQHLGYTPRNGWAIDPFGMSPTMSYFLKRTGLSNMVIQRTHYAVKKHLSNIQELEFKWRQMWDTQGSADMLCHMMPFYSYDIPHTCGPDPRICCQFDFKRMNSVSRLYCPWNVAPQPIIHRNIQERSLTLLDQYRKKAMLYKTNTLLVPLGDDFRWEDGPEWDAQITNYAKLFDYINSQADLNAEVKFGTLEDYFKALNQDISSGQFTPSVLSGDFFTYADRDQHYWSGYFTSRPFHKAMDRELMAHLRAAHIAFTLMTAEISKRNGGLTENPFVRSLLGKLIKARRHLSLFQHHDGVTGTSKDHVMVDYASKLFNGLNNCNHVMQQSFHVLTHLTDTSFDVKSITDESLFYEPAIAKDEYHSLPHYNMIVLDREMSERLVTIFNPIARTRTQLVNLYVSTYHVKVVDMNDKLLEFEVLPVFEERSTIARNIFQLSFIAELGPLSVKSFIIKFAPESKNSAQPEVYVVNCPSPILDHEEFRLKELQASQPIQISNNYMQIDFDTNGFIKSVTMNGKTHPLNIIMMKYGAKGSGLYLFLPDGKAVPLVVEKPFIKIVKGKFQSYVEVWLTQIKHRITINNHPGFEQYSIEVKNLVDIRNERNFELVMRLKSNIQSKDISYTDLNGFQMIRRKTFEKLPLQANFYPLPAATYIEDNDLRMTVLSKQPLGTASLASGEIEVIMDRRLMQDDGRGAGQGSTDNLETMNVFKILLETPLCEDKDEHEKAPMLSLPSQLTLHDMLHQFQTFTGPMKITAGSLSSVSDYLPAPGSLACDIELVDATPIPSYENTMDDNSYLPTAQSGLLIRRLGFDGRFIGGVPLPKCSVDDADLGNFNLKDIVGDLFESKVQQMTLSFVHEGKVLSHNESIRMRPMEIYGFMVKFHVNSNGEANDNAKEVVDNMV